MDLQYPLPSARYIECATKGSGHSEGLNYVFILAKMTANSWGFLKQLFAVMVPDKKRSLKHSKRPEPFVAHLMYHVQRGR